MSSIPKGRLLATTTLASFDPIIRAFLDDLLRRGEVAESRVRHYRTAARHFLVWLESNAISLGAVDITVIGRFLQHDCDCCGVVPTSARVHPWRKRRTSPEIMRFVRFLERTGRTETPGDLDDNLGLLEIFLERLRNDGYAQKSVTDHRCACAALVVWLHLSRICLSDLTPDIYARFWNRPLTHSIIGEFGGRRTHSRGGVYVREISKFLEYLAAIGRIEPLESGSEEKGLPERLEMFSVWLDHNRGIRPTTIRRYVRQITAILPALGDAPRAYDAAMIRRVLLESIEHLTREAARDRVTAMRMYLRFLVSEGRVAPALVEAVPTVPRWRLSGLPRYIPADDVERAIASCGDDPLGVRDRAILLLLARLALRAGDVVALRLNDIDWDRAEIRVSGKSGRQTALPLPQDVGDALFAYISTVRPRVAEEKVFLCATAPWRPLALGGTVSCVAGRALDRAGVRTFTTRGAHVFRHSRATELLRSGATLDTIQSLLRHASRNTTMIYAKTDAVMLQEVAQPWIGRVEQ